MSKPPSRRGGSRKDFGRWSPLTPPPSGYFCNSPLIFQHEGEWKQINCNKCARCHARIKNDWVGRCQAEAMTAQSVVALTLTYADLTPFPTDGRPWVQERQLGAKSFAYPDVQRFLKRLRNEAEKEAAEASGLSVRDYRKARKAGEPVNEPVTFRYICAGERGERATKRCHWHLMLYIAGPVPKVLAEAMGRAKPDGRTWMDDQWPYGHIGKMNALPNPQERRAEVLKAVRYVAKYCRKKVGQSRADVRFTYSSSPAIGTAYIEGWARHTVEAGLPLRKYFELPGGVFTRGPKAGKAQRCYVFGRVAEHYVQAFLAAWDAKYPDTFAPYLPWMAHACRGRPRHKRGEPRDIWRGETCGPINGNATMQPFVKGYRRPLAVYGPHGKPPTLAELAERKKPPGVGNRDCSGWMMVQHPDGRTIGALTVGKRGNARFAYTATDRVVPVCGDDLVGIADVPPSRHDAIRAWLAERRGPDWLPPDVYKLACAERLAAMRKAQLRIGEMLPGGALERAARRIVDAEFDEEGTGIRLNEARRRHLRSRFNLADAQGMVRSVYGQV